MQEFEKWASGLVSKETVLEQLGYNKTKSTIVEILQRTVIIRHALLQQQNKVVGVFISAHCESSSYNSSEIIISPGQSVVISNTGSEIVVERVKFGQEA